MCKIMNNDKKCDHSGLNGKTIRVQDAGIRTCLIVTWTYATPEQLKHSCPC